MSARTVTLKKKIAILMTCAVVIIGLAGWLILYSAEKRDNIDDICKDLSHYLAYMAQSAEEDGFGEIEKLSSLWTSLYPDGRVTIVSQTGDVILDTSEDASRMDNHYTRGEVMRAFASGEGMEMRYSSTQDEWRIYLARRMSAKDDSEVYVVRLSYPSEKISILIREVTIPFLKYFTILLVLVWLGVFVLLRLFMQPLNALSHSAELIARGEEVRFPLTNEGEVKTLANTLNFMQDSLHKTIREAQERKDELSQLVGALPVGVILIDNDKKIRYINKEAATICGRVELPHKGSSVEVILPSDELYTMLDEPDETKNFTVMRNGATMHIEATTLMLPRGRLVVLHDLTEKARLEEVRRDFFIDAGHEFQTPLAIIRTGLEVLKGSPNLQKPECEEDVETIESLVKQQERISGLVDDLLLLVRLDSAPTRMNTEDTDLAEIAEEVREEISALPQKKETDIEINAPEGGAHLTAVYADLRRAILNIMENAQKYIQFADVKRGMINVDIESDGDSWKFTVDDNGPGVAPEDRELIFERFRRGDNHRARGVKKSGGYGLGLSISRRIAERHDGTLELGESKLGGTAFVLTLPKKAKD